MNKPRTHLLKIWPENFDAIASGRKRADIRGVDDRSFSVGDEIVFRRWDGSAQAWPRESAADLPVAGFDDIDPSKHVEALRAIKGIDGWLVCRVTHVEELAGDLHLFGITLCQGHRFGKLTKSAVLSIEPIG